MLQKTFYSLPAEKANWSQEPLGVFFPLAPSPEKSEPRWTIQVNEKQRSGRFPSNGDSAGVSTALKGGPGRYVFKNREKQIVLEQSWTWRREEEGHLYLVSPLTFFHLIFDPRLVKAAIYPTYLQANEEVQFPVLGAEHFIYLVSGKVCWIDRESDNTKLLEQGHMLQVSRTNFKKEYLNLKVKGIAEKTTALWGVLHYLSNHKRT